MEFFRPLHRDLDDVFSISGQIVRFRDERAIRAGENQILGD
jgi:hypothetical protein